MSISAKVAPPNSLVLVADSNAAEIPETMAGSLIASTNSCIAIGCLSEVDGETEFTLGSTREVDPGHQPAFQGTLKTPNQKIAIRTVLGQTILETTVPRQKTVVAVWVNDSTEPDKIIVGVN